MSRQRSWGLGLRWTASVATPATRRFPSSRVWPRSHSTRRRPAGDRLLSPRDSACAPMGGARCGVRGVHRGGLRRRAVRLRRRPLVGAGQRRGPATQPLPAAATVRRPRTSNLSKGGGVYSRPGIGSGGLHQRPRPLNGDPGEARVASRPQFARTNGVRVRAARKRRPGVRTYRKAVGQAHGVDPRNEDRPDASAPGRSTDMCGGSARWWAGRGFRRVWPRGGRRRRQPPRELPGRAPGSGPA